MVLRAKFVDPSNNGVKIAFKLPDGTKTEFCFSINANIMIT